MRAKSKAATIFSDGAPAFGDQSLARRDFCLAAGETMLGVLGLALLPATAGRSTRQRSLEWRMGGPVRPGLPVGTICIVTPGEDVAPGVSAGHVVSLVYAPAPGSPGAVFLYAPGMYVYSRSDDKWVGKDNAHYACIIDRRRLRLLV